MNYGKLSCASLSYQGQTADHSVVVFGAFFGVLLTGIWFGYARKRYQGPHVSLPIERSRAVLMNSGSLP
jgi:hypothetical protein